MIVRRDCVSLSAGSVRDRWIVKPFKIKSMKNIVEYEAPAIEVSEVRLECGIAASIRTEDYVETEGVW